MGRGEITESTLFPYMCWHKGNTGIQTLISTKMF